MSERPKNISRRNAIRALAFIGSSFVLTRCAKPNAQEAVILDSTSTPTFLKSLSTENSTITSSPTVTPSSILFPTAEKTPENSKGIFPLKEFEIISPFLEKRWSNGQVTYHLGLDFFTKPENKRQVLSPDKGKLVWFGNTQLGNVVIVEYEWRGESIYPVFAHLEKMIEGKEPGDKISTGEIIGKMGKTGTDNIHLHLQVWKQKGWREKVVGENNIRLNRDGWSDIAGTYPFLDNKETVKTYLHDPRVWLVDITGIDLKGNTYP